MNKSELIDEIATKADLSKAKAKAALEAFLESVTTSLKKEEDVLLVGFGTFKVSHRKERMGRNPQNGQEIKIPASKVPIFSAGKSLKDVVNNR